jgi:hypothetical protein
MSEEVLEWLPDTMRVLIGVCWYADRTQCSCGQWKAVQVCSMISTCFYVLTSDVMWQRAQEHILLQHIFDRLRRKRNHRYRSGYYKLMRSRLGRKGVALFLKLPPSFLNLSLASLLLSPTNISPKQRRTIIQACTLHIVKFRSFIKGFSWTPIIEIHCISCHQQSIRNERIIVPLNSYCLGII